LQRLFGQWLGDQMKVWTAMALGALVLAAPAVQADVAATPWTPTAAGEFSASSVSPSVEIGPIVWLDSEFGSSMALPGGSGLSPEQDTQQVQSLPDTPGSAALMLLGLGSLGALQAGRSAKKFQFGHFASWYHSGGPRQIGYSFAIDLEKLSNINDLAVCLFEAIVEVIPSGPLLQRQPVLVWRQAQACPAATECRGPPQTC